jgi:ubiquinol-cytochrome c reductase cytochrome c1 subunit
MMRAIAIRVLAALLLASSGATLAAEEGGPRLLTAPSESWFAREASLQRGARNFVNYCLNCHGARFMRYSRLTDLGLTEAMVSDNLMFASDKIGNTMTVAMSEADGKAWFGVAPPDLSVIARVRGKDWLYSYLLAFYRDAGTVSGWNNLVFPNVAMPHVLWNLSGPQKLVETEYPDLDKAEAAAIAAKGLASVEPAAEGKFVVRTLALDAPGSLTTAQYEAFVSDLVNYLDFMGEPVKHERINIGIMVLIFMSVLFVLVYSLKRDYWKEVH